MEEMWVVVWQEVNAVKNAGVHGLFSDELMANAVVEKMNVASKVIYTAYNFPVCRSKMSAGKTAFKIIDAQTNEEPDLEKIVRNEDWARGFICYTVFGVNSNGEVCLFDDYGGYRIAPADRFRIIWQFENMR